MSTLLNTAMARMSPFIMLLALPALSACGDRDETRQLEPVSPSIHPEMAAHTDHFERRIYQVGERVHVAVGWNLANTSMIVGDDGVIIIDTGENAERTRQVAEKFREITDKPVRAVVYTHFHPDHINGTGAFTSLEQVRAGEVDIFAHDTFEDHVADQGATLGPILSMRTAYSFGAALPPADREGVNAGLGPLLPLDEETAVPATYIPPSRTFSDELEIEIAGVQLRMLHIPGETDDQIGVYLPDEGVLFTGDTLQGPTLPNIHTLRGTSFRDPMQWVDTIDLMRSLAPEYVVDSHGQPIHGREQSEEVLRYTRDGIQFIHDQTIRHMNKGLTPDELVHAVQFPEHLAEYKPWLREYYGTVEHTVRQIYQGYLGWFEGDPVDLAPTPREEKARRLTDLIGGRDAVLDAAYAAHDDGDYQWAAELATYLIRIDRDDSAARELKANAFRHLGYAQMNFNWRSWYLMAARELEGDVPVRQLAEVMRETVSSTALFQNLPIRIWLRGWAMRVDPERAADTHSTLGMRFTDIDEAYALELRRGVVEVHESIPEGTELVLNMSRTLLNRLLAGEQTIPGALAAGEAELQGDSDAFAQFVDNFDLEEDAIYLTLR